MHALGHPGTRRPGRAAPRTWVGCVLGSSRLWFTTGYGILNQLYHPRADLAQIRDLGFIVADGKGFWVEVKRLGRYLLIFPRPGIPLLELVHLHPRVELRQRMAPDPQREALLIEVTLTGDDALRPYALLAPHLCGSGKDNWAGVGEHRDAGSCGPKRRRSV
jgi:glucoamylase